MRITKSFNISIPDNVYDISSSFGIEQTYKLNVIDVNLPDELPDITYITGQSGSGKSVLLHEICSEFNIHQVNIVIPTEPLINWSNDYDRNVSLLSSCGLSDITQMLSTYEMLSDSQKARALIYYNILKNNNIIVVDEFLSTLDRMTAKTVSYCIQKVIRNHKIKLIACTAHDDLANYLQPDMIITGKSYPSIFTVNEFKYTDYSYPFDVNVIITTKEVYRESNIGKLHYKGKYTGGTKDFLTVFVDGYEAGHLVTTNRMSQPGRKISRVVVHPSFRGIGVAKALVSKLISMYPDSVIDATASMGKYNPFLEKAGLKFDKINIFKPPKYIIDILKKYDFDFSKWGSRTYCVNFANNELLREELAQFANKLQRFVDAGTREITIEELQYKIKNEQHTVGRIIHRNRETEQYRYKN